MDLPDSIHAGTQDPSHLKITRVCTVHSNNTERSIPEWSLLTVTAESVNAHRCFASNEGEWRTLSKPAMWNSVPKSCTSCNVICNLDRDYSKRHRKFIKVLALSYEKGSRLRVHFTHFWYPWPKIIFLPTLTGSFDSGDIYVQMSITCRYLNALPSCKTQKIIVYGNRTNRFVSRRVMVMPLWPCDDQVRLVSESRLSVV